MVAGPTPYISLVANHYILCTEFSISFLAPPKRRVVRVVDWDKFRQLRQTAPDTIADLDAWATSIAQDVEQATSTVPEPEEVAAAQSRLLHIRDGRWTNTIHSRGSDHNILCTEFSISSLAPRKKRTACVVDWDKLRRFRQTAPDTIADLHASPTLLTQDVEQATSTIPAPEDVAAAGNCLLQMWEAHASLQKCWLAQKHNRFMKRRIARLVTDIKAHASNLAHQQWGQVCDRMSGNLSLKNTWSFLRFLFDPGHKNHSRKELYPQIPLEDDALLQVLKDQYLSTYTGAPNPAFDEKISASEGRLDIGPPPTLTVTIDGTPISEVEKVRVHGILLQNIGKNTATISKLTATVHQTVRLIYRMAN
ncbi:hypothetical protein HPB49_010935 [Dermacentor silvarum]|uniref:Uncharacterized protein n=1 Tax=Dermacentor silvarum TaxID=543639 RepID=A0ACB8C327_DERSI|nr:hypothetical protein HPB49_010935 [Dermacentor silvarum]